MPYWRLSNFYFFYFASIGALVPYWSLYLKDLGFSIVEIGQLMALLMATKIVSPNIWGWIADHTGWHMGVVRWGSFLACLFFIGIFFVQDYWSVAIVMMLFSFFWNATLPQFEVATLNHLGKDHHRYSGIRLWGSIGFIVSVALLGLLLDLYDSSLLPIVLLVIFTGTWLSSIIVPEQLPQTSSLEHTPILQIVKRPEVIALMLVCFLMQASHGPYYTFYTLYLESFHYSRTLIGKLWALGVVAEVIIFLMMSHLVKYYGLRQLLLASLLLTSLRWGMIATFPENLWLLLIAQLLHAASFGVFHAVVIALFYRHFTGKTQGRGQALYSSLSFGLGGAFGALYSGVVWESISQEMTYYIAMVFSLSAFAIAWVWIDRVKVYSVMRSESEN